LPARRVYHVLNALDLTNSRWDPATDGSGVRAELGIAPDAPVIGIVSRLFLWKGHTYLVQAMRRIAEQVPAARLVIVGDDDLRAHPNGTSYLAELKALVGQLGLQQQVIFTPFRTDVPAVMAAFDVFAMPSWDEPFGMVYVEAMAMKRPVVAWAMGGALEVVADGETGFLPATGDVDGLTDALLTLIRDPDLRRRMGEAGRRRAERQFNPRRMCADMVEVYRDVLGEARASDRVQG
jgi:glycosyltransferase involved in cell wall biosynthesis